jgi:hypothetical protein
MKLSTHLLPTYFTIADSTNSHFQIPTNCFDFVDRGSDTLVVTVGDSWTYGEDLNTATRLQDVYGNVVSQQLGADWLNLAQSGANNFFIAERVEELGELVPELDYTAIYLICTFTETGRSFDSHHDAYIDYVSWFQHNDIDKFLAFLNAECYNRVCAVAKQHHMTLRVGTNFVDPIGFPVNFTAWFRQLGIACSALSCVGHTGVSRLGSVEQFVNNRKQFQQWFSELIDVSAHTDTVCRSPVLFNAHPTASGHKIWADCILESIK